MSERTRSILNHLAAMPEYGNAAAEKDEVREIMLQTGGWMLACGHQWDIKAKQLGAGVYRLTLERR